MNRRQFLKKGLEGIIIGIPLISGYAKNPAKSELYTTIHKTENGLIFGYVRLKISGFTNGDRVTYLNYGDGITMEIELKLSKTKEFEEDVPICFTNCADDIPRKYHTVVTAYKENDKISIEIESEELTYLTGLEELIIIPEKYLLFQNYPNPFNPETTIKYQLPRTSKVNLTIYNILGQKIKTLVDEEKQAGFYSVIWDGTNNIGIKVSSGIYIYRMVTNNGFIETRKLVFFK